MISIVIRNKNESVKLERILSILTNQYKDDVDEIILIDNNSTDNSIEIAEKYECRIEGIKNFTYGKAINLGMSCARNQYVLLLSSHAVPIGQSFFKSALKAFERDNNIAGLRFVNSIKDYERALNNNFLIEKPLKNGLMAACAMVNKSIWQLYKFNEKLHFSEDKEWSDRVIKDGFKIIQIPETFFYFPTRNSTNKLSRIVNETTAHIILTKSNPPSVSKILMIFIYQLTFKNIKNSIKSIVYDYKLLKAKLKIRKNVINYIKNDI